MVGFSRFFLLIFGTFMRSIVVVFFLSLIFSVTVSQAQTLSPKLLTAMEAAGPTEKIAVIIELSDKADLLPFLARGRFARLMSAQERKTHRSSLITTLKAKASLSQGRVLRFLRNNSVASLKSLWINNSIVAELNPGIIQLLAVMPGISRIKTDGVIKITAALPAEVNSIEDNIALVKAPDLWALGFDGQGMVVATMDSGVDIDHPDIGARWRGNDLLGNSWFDPNGEHPLVPTDVDGHGTGVVGVMVGGDAGGTSIGVAPGAEWIAVKIFDDLGAARNSIIHEGFQWLLDPDNNPATDDAPDVVNNSWGFEQNPGECLEMPDPNNPGSDFDTDFHPDISALQAAGIAVVFSGGNLGPAAGTDISPGNYPESFAVGSVDTLSSEISIFSSRGPSSCDGSVYPEIVASGDSILTAYLTLGGIFPDSYVLRDGTSFSAPQVAGIMALLIQAFPETPLADIESALLASSQDLGDLGPDNDYGNGLIDAFAAYNWLLWTTTSGVITPNGGEVYPIGSTINIHWAAHPDAVRYRASYFDVDSTEHPIVNGNVINYAWTIPVDAVIEAGKTFRVVAFDATGTRIAADWADGPFTIDPAPGTVLVPNGGEVYPIGSTINIHWAAHPDAVRYRASYFDVDSTEHPIVNGNVINYAWTIPVDAVIEAGKTFRVVAFDATGTRIAADWADGPFEITQ